MAYFANKPAFITGGSSARIWQMFDPAWKGLDNRIIHIDIMIMEGYATRVCCKCYTLDILGDGCDTRAGVNRQGL